MTPVGDCYLLDMLPHVHDMIDWLRTLLEHPNVMKVIHDCRKDADALQHHLNIKLVNVHDTSCWHTAITSEVQQGLNAVLHYNGLPINNLRDNSIYERVPPFWLDRPMTSQMMAYASGILGCSAHKTRSHS